MSFRHCEVLCFMYYVICIHFEKRGIILLTVCFTDGNVFACFKMKHLNYFSDLFFYFEVNVIYSNQGREFAHSLICSFPSNQMSDCEQFNQIAQDK